MKPALNERLDRFESPFRRLDALLSDIVPAPSLQAIGMHVGEPQDSPPSLLRDAVSAHANQWNRYPPSLGTPDLLAAIGGYLGRRYPGTLGRLDVSREVTSLASTREGLALAAAVCISPSREGALAWMPNPFYQTYRVAAIMAGAQPRYLRHSGFPRFEVTLGELDADALSRTALLTLCSPSNPDGRVLSPATIERAVTMAREHGFMVLFDECYAELYDREPPQGALGVLARMDSSSAWLDNVIVMHSLSKRSSAAGLRSGFAVGAADAIAALNRLRLNATACVPMPLQAASAALWSDEVHVQQMRERLRARFDLADRFLAGHPGYYRPDCGFFLWLRAGDGAELTRRLWRDAALRVLPGEYLTQPLPDGTNEGAPYIRLALVHDLATTEEGLRRLAGVLAA